MKARPIILIFIAPLLWLGSAGCSESCQDIKENAYKIVYEYKRCREFEYCAVVNLCEIAGTGNCLEGFQRTTAINSKSDLEKLKADINGAIEDYLGCFECSYKECEPAVEFVGVCNRRKGMCETIKLEDYR